MSAARPSTPTLVLALTVLFGLPAARAQSLVERFLGRPFNADAWRAWLEGEED